MNIRNNFIVVVIIGCMGLSSCLKDKYGKNFKDIPDTKLIELAPNDNPSLGANDRLYFLNFNVTAAPQVYQVAVHLNSSTGSYSQDVTVVLQRDPTAIADYNTANGTAYGFLPDSTFTESGLSVTIPKGMQFGYLNLSINTAKVDPLGQYMVAYKVVSATGGVSISDTRGAAQFVISVKNSYDGIYSLRINTIGWGAYGIADGVPQTYPGNFGLITAGANAVTLFNYLRSDVLQPALTSAGAPTAFGAAAPKFTFDATTNKLVSVVNTIPDDGRGRAFLLNPAITTSRYDPATKTIYAAYLMKQNGRPDQQIYDTLIFIKSR